MGEMTIDLQTTVSQSDDHVSADIGGEVVMMSMEQRSYYGIGDVGSRVWELIEEPRAVGDIMDRLLNKYEIDRDTYPHDVKVFLERLAEEIIASKFGVANALGGGTAVRFL